MRRSLDVRRDYRRSILLKQQPEIHDVNVVCATCGTALSIRSTASVLSVDVCSNCHPAYTGVERPAFSGSRIERFNRRLGRATA
jgi:large subunit ribosomal protein L31